MDILVHLGNMLEWTLFGWEVSIQLGSHGAGEVGRVWATY
jgi:hypothetical protein